MDNGKWNVNRETPIYNVLQSATASNQYYNRIGFTYRTNTIVYTLAASDTSYNNSGWNSKLTNGNDAESSIHLWINPYAPAYIEKDESTGVQSDWINFSIGGTTIEDINGNSVTGFLYPIDKTIYFAKAQYNSDLSKIYVLIDEEYYSPSGYIITCPETIPAI